MDLFIIRSEAPTSGIQYLRWNREDAESLYSDLAEEYPDRKIILETFDIEKIIIDVVDDAHRGLFGVDLIQEIRSRDPKGIRFSEPVPSKRESDGADVLYLSAFLSNGAATRFVIEPRNIRDSWKVTVGGEPVGRVYLESEGIPEFVAEPDALTEIGRSESLIGAAKILIENYLK